MRVGVKFCGNCNPRYNASELVRRLASLSDIEFVRWDDQSGYQVLLVLNSCQVGCATIPLFDGPNIMVTSNSVQCWPVREEEIRDAVWNVLRKYSING